MTRTIAALCGALAVLAVGCGGATSESTGAPSAVEAPTELPVEDGRLLLSTYAWQDQMPTVGDEPGSCASLCVNGTVEVAGGGPLPEDLEVLDIVAIVDGEPFPFEEQDLRGRLGPSNFEFVVGRGPALQPGTTFDLAVQLRVDGEERWIRAPRVTVERTA